jgi:hypothetical protein
MFMVIMFPSVMNIALPGTGLFSWIGTAYSTGKTHCVDFDEGRSVPEKRPHIKVCTRIQHIKREIRTEDYQVDSKFWIMCLASQL